MSHRQTKLKDIRKQVERIDAWLSEHAKPLSRSLRPGADKAAIEHAQLEYKYVSALFAARDGQKSGAGPIFDGWRLIPSARVLKLKRQYRGLSYRSDWNDSWTPIAVATTGKMLLCVINHSGKVESVDVSNKKRYKKSVVALTLLGWLEDFAEDLEGGRLAYVSKPPRLERLSRKRAPAKPVRKKVAAPTLDSTPAKSWTAIERYLAANAPTVSKALLEPATEKAIASTEKVVGASLPVAVKNLWKRHDGQNTRGRYIFGNWQFLPLKYVSKEWGVNVKIGQKLDDATFWKRTWLPITSDGAGNFQAVCLKDGKVREVLNDPYVRRVSAPSLRVWLARHARNMCHGKYDESYEDL